MLLQKDSTLKWTVEGTEVVEKLKNIIISEPVLKIFDPNHETIIYKDASREGFADIINQIDNKIEKPVTYFNKQVTKEEKNYYSFELELLAIVKTFQGYRYYLAGGKEY